jgi:transcriptional regulator with XRE-family HTH domain
MQGITSQDTTGRNSELREVPSDISDAIFARRLRQVREQAGMTQQALADLMARTGNKIHRSTIGKIENGDRPVTIGEAVQLAGILGADLAELITDPAPDAVAEARRARVRAQVRVRALQREIEERDRALQEARLLRASAASALQDAQQQLAGLGELPAGGKDDQ